MGRVDVRRAGVSDAETIGRLLYDFNQEFDAGGPTADEFAQRFSALLKRDDVVVVLAVEESVAVGFAFLTLRPTPYYRDGSFAQLEELYVVPTHRSAGIGSSLLHNAIDLSRERGGREMHINVDEVDAGARRFYERHGFCNVEPGKDYRMLCYVQEF